jgi:hypothetical protein
VGHLSLEINQHRLKAQDLALEAVGIMGGESDIVVDYEGVPAVEWLFVEPVKETPCF